jgi:hypothetical protein
MSPWEIWKDSNLTLQISTYILLEAQGAEEIMILARKTLSVGDLFY